MAREKRAAYRSERYWGRPVPGFGDARAPIVMVGLAPGAHGANRTGRIFTGDRSGDFLYAALHRVRLSSQPTSTAKDDGLRLAHVFVTCPVKCAPPDNRPTPAEVAACAPFFDAELRALAPLPKRVFVALGALGWRACLDHFARVAPGPGAPKPRGTEPFAHGKELACGPHVLLGSYHVSQQNTQTGRLTPAMFDAVLRRAVSLAGLALH